MQYLICTHYFNMQFKYFNEQTLSSSNIKSKIHYPFPQAACNFLWSQHPFLLLTPTPCFIFQNKTLSSLYESKYGSYVSLIHHCASPIFVGLGAPNRMGFSSAQNWKQFNIEGSHCGSKHLLAIS